MLVDFHTHFFPEALAEKAVASLLSDVEKRGNSNYCHIPATYDGLLGSMAEDGVDISVSLPVVTAPRQEDSILRFAKEIQDRNQEAYDAFREAYRKNPNQFHWNEKTPLQPVVVNFAGFFPGMEQGDSYLEEIKSAGFLGLKVHPEFQHTYVDSLDFISMMKRCEELGLYVVIHAGEDIGLLPPVYSEPKRIANLLEKVSGGHLICAHMGGWNRWDDVEQYLVGTNVFLDTSFVKDYISPEQWKRMIRNHGAEKILFGTDSPWEKPRDTLAALKSLSLSDEEMDQICFKNALNILF